MKTTLKLSVKCFTIISILLLAACNLKTNLPVQGPVTGPVTVVPTGNPITLTEEPVAATEQPITGTEEAVVLDDPGAGAPMLWTDGSYVVYVPAGEFVMGRDETTASDHSPAHTVTLNAFWIHQTEVTNRMYATCVELGVCTPPAHNTGTPYWYTNPVYANAPVVGVDWNQAEAYCEWIEGRLPTEAEWEKAARGTEGDPYPWGEDEPTCNLLNFEDCLPKPAPEIVRAYPLGASPYKLADMAGNVFEWVFDWYANDYYSSSPSSNPTGPDTGEQRVVRGSSYLSPAEDLNITLRDSHKPNQQRVDLGFRCVLNGETVAEQPPAPACTTLAYDLVIPVHQWAEQEPVPPPALALEVYCNLDNQNNQYGTATIWLDQSVDPEAVTISSPQGSLFCNQDIVDPQKFNCSGAALHPGSPVTISVCNIPPVQAVANPTCPVYYHFDANTNLCEYGIPQLIQCAVPDVVIPGYGCLPAPQNGECPAGSYSATYNNKPVCVPAGGPKCQGLLCPATCPAGLVFNEGNFCCDYPTDVSPTCPPGLSYDETLKFCLPDVPIQASCTNITTPVPICPTPVPPPTCSDNSTKDDCTASGCVWHPYSVMAGGYCSDN